MHTFQPISTDYLDMNPFNKIGKEWMLITAGDENKCNTMTASWGGMGVLWGKNVVYIFVRESRYTKEFLDAKDYFTINFMDEKYRMEMKYLGAVSGRKEDKIANAKVGVDYSAVGAPYIDDSNLVLVCRKLSATKLTPEQFVDASLDATWYSDKDYHTMYVGEIVEALAR